MHESFKWLGKILRIRIKYTHNAYRSNKIQQQKDSTFGMLSAIRMGLCFHSILTVTLALGILSDDD